MQNVTYNINFNAEIIFSPPTKLKNIRECFFSLSKNSIDKCFYFYHYTWGVICAKWFDTIFYDHFITRFKGLLSTLCKNHGIPMTQIFARILTVQIVRFTFPKIGLVDVFFRKIRHFQKSISPDFATVSLHHEKKNLLNITCARICYAFSMTLARSVACLVICILHSYAWNEI